MIRYLTVVFIAAVVAMTLTAAMPERSAQYRRDGPALLPDPGATPGATRDGASLSQLCSKSFHTSRYRHTTQKMKRIACLAYGLGHHCWGRGGNEIDHLISLELGGADTQKNLWPEPYLPKPGAREKDKVENWLHREVCAGKIDLSTAQAEIASDWYAVYRKMYAGAK